MRAHAAMNETGVTECLTTGYLLSKTKRLVRVAQSKHNRERQPDVVNHWGNVMCIPRAVVRRIRRCGVQRGE